LNDTYGRERSKKVFYLGKREKRKISTPGKERRVCRGHPREEKKPSKKKSVGGGGKSKGKKQNVVG